MPQVRFLPDEKRVDASLGEGLLELARRANVDLAGPCGGKALCGKCLVKIIEGKDKLSDPTDNEFFVIGTRRIQEGYRLACRCRIVKEGEVTVFVPSESRLEEHSLLVEGEILEERFDPAITCLRVKIPARAYGSIVENLPREFSFRLTALRKISKFSGSESEKELVVYNDEVIDVRDESRPLGFAADIGTTKVAGYLVDLKSGALLAVASDLNPQIAYGEDVVSRIDYALRNGVEELRTKIIDCLNKLITTVCDATRSITENVYEFVLVGNTAMQHFLLGLEPKTLAYFPYTPVTRSPMNVKACELELLGNPEAMVFIPPIIAGYIGSDVLADIIATGMFRGDDPEMLIDIGTNTEIVLKKGDKFLACSTASGPAFEGAHITHGMRAARGAIDRIEISSNGEVKYTVIGGTRPIGLTGSAVVDVVAELLSARIIDESGRLRELTDRVRMGKDGYLEFVIEYGENTATGEDIVFTQKDIREIQLAKAAIRAGVNILMKRLGVNPSDIRRLYIAGAFGFFTNPLSARTLGLYPDIDVSRIRLVGNSAGAGARAMLLSKSLRSLAYELAQKIEHIELAAEPDFQKEFLKSIPFSDRI
ncbi:MAG: ASKHA domain-containing protein [Thaumarchaeota archaeon]|jgi:uncharacterized 2Fe-2S/4Fe-4S cluster protein (DUF4445 family)|nr:ASKHA domain-containing protein [Candidatus Terraquivivens yellowstonensis]MCL7399186.1 ASKHA domain-containing protein [Candidatus Terraquivivens yellowstonensis]MCL7399958.1 ASKHA domain-containing protein [Candidatus Terraquivivens yellowstonensis]